MKKKNENTLLRGLLIVCVALTTLVAIVLGLIVAVKPGNPIATIMNYIQNGFKPEEDPEGGNNVHTDEAGGIIPDETFDENDIFTLPPGIVIPEETKPGVITIPSVITGSPTEDTDKPAEDTRPSTDPESPVTKPQDQPVTPPVTSAPPVNTDPPVTSAPPAPVDPSDRVNDPDYFKDALFIGDSRTVGFYNYARIEGATYFARTSMNVKTCFNDSPSETGTGDYNLAELLMANDYGKIYILLGINEIGYSLSWIENNYKQIVSTIQSLEPNAIIIIQSNMHVTKAKSDATGNNPFKNSNIDALNARLATFADNQRVFYLDTTSPFDDETGNLRADYSGDGVHFKGKCYAIWRDYILQYGKR